MSEPTRSMKRWLARGGLLLAMAWTVTSFLGPAPTGDGGWGLLGVAAAEGAVAPGAGLPLTLEEALEGALAGPEARATGVAWEAALAGAEQAIAATRPRVQVNAGAGAGREEPALLLGALSPQVEVTLGLTLPFAPDAVAAAQQSEREREEAALARRADLERVVQTTWLAYLQLLDAQEAREVAGAETEVAADALQLVEERVAKGAATEADLRAARARLASAQAAAAAAQTDRDEARLTLEGLLDLTMSGEILAVDAPDPAWLVPRWEEVEAALSTGDLLLLEKIALEERADVRKAQLAVERAESGIDAVARSGEPTGSITLDHYLPDAGAGLSLGLTSSLAVRAGVSWTDTPSTGAARAPDPWSVTLQLSWPLLDGGLTRARVEQARAGLEGALLQVEMTQERVRAEVHLAVARLERSQARLRAAEEAEARTLHLLQVAGERRELGTATELEWAEAELVQREQRASVDAARRAVQSDQVRLAATLGLIGGMAR